MIAITTVALCCALVNLVLAVKRSKALPYGIMVYWAAVTIYWAMNFAGKLGL